jgi:hypothetical protein
VLFTSSRVLTLCEFLGFIEVFSAGYAIGPLAWELDVRSN